MGEDNKSPGLIRVTTFTIFMCTPARREHPTTVLGSSLVDVPLGEGSGRPRTRSRHSLSAHLEKNAPGSTNLEAEETVRLVL